MKNKELIERLQSMNPDYEVCDEYGNILDYVTTKYGKIVIGSSARSWVPRSK